jgi:hypothetical protein
MKHGKVQGWVKTVKRKFKFNALKIAGKFEIN